MHELHMKRGKLIGTFISCCSAYLYEQHFKRVFLKRYMQRCGGKFPERCRPIVLQFLHDLLDIFVKQILGVNFNDNLLGFWI